MATDLPSRVGRAERAGTRRGPRVSAQAIAQGERSDGGLTLPLTTIVRYPDGEGTVGTDATLVISLVLRQNYLFTST